MNKPVIHSTSGKLAKGIIVLNDDNSHTAHITFKSGGKMHMSTDRINLRAMKAKDAAEAIDKVCHGTGRIVTYQVTEVPGTAAMTRTYSSPHKGQETGYGLLIRRGQKTFAFALTRIDLVAMKSKTIAAAMRKAAFTGRITTIQTDPEAV